MNPRKVYLSAAWPVISYTRRSRRSLWRMIRMSQRGRQTPTKYRGTERAVSYHMMRTTPSDDATVPIGRTPLHVEALTLYEAVARGVHVALLAPRLPSSVGGAK